MTTVLLAEKCPDVAPTTISAMADSGAQSCLWSLNGFYAAGFSNKHLIPVNVDLVAANKSPIKINGAVLLRLNGLSANGVQLSCACMVYIGEQARGFYLSREAMMELGIVSKDFPIGWCNSRETRLCARLFQTLFYVTNSAY